MTMRKKRFSFPVSPLVGSSVSNIFSLWRKHKVDLLYYPKFIFTVIIAGIFELFNFWERILLRNRLKNYKMKEPPVFIIGFWRSGTTLLHNLLCEDPKAGYTTTFQVVFPHSSITQAWWLKKLTNWLLPPGRPFDNVRLDMDFPQEDEYALVAIHPYSIYNLFSFPDDFDRIIKKNLYTGKFSPDHLKKWQKNYRRLVDKAMINTGGTRYMSKNPCNLARLELLSSMFPEARFIFIYRNPYSVVESLYRFILAVFPGTQLQKVPSDFTREKVVKLYAELMHYYLKVKHRMPENALIEIKMEDFMRDKIGFLKNIYDTFCFPDFETVKPDIEKYLEKNSRIHREPYEISAETYLLMNTHAADIITELGYSLEKPEQN